VRSSFHIFPVFPPLFLVPFPYLLSLFFFSSIREFPLFRNGVRFCSFAFWPPSSLSVCFRCSPRRVLFLSLSIRPSFSCLTPALKRWSFLTCIFAYGYSLFLYVPLGLPLLPVVLARPGRMFFLILFRRRNF